MYTNPTPTCGDRAPSPIRVDGADFIPACGLRPGHRGKCRWYHDFISDGNVYVTWPTGARRES